MKLKSSQITAVLMACLAGFFIFTAIRQPSTQVNGAVSTETSNREDTFLKEIRGLQKDSRNGEVLAAALPAVTDDPDNVAVIELETRDLDLGLIPSDVTTERQVKIFNRGKAPLRISDLTTTCGCTQGRIPEEHKTIEPGGEGYMDVAVIPGRITGFDSSKVLTLFSNDPKNSQITLVVRAQLEPEFILDPPQLDLGQFQKGERIDRTLIVRQGNFDGLEIKEVTITRPGSPKAPFLDFEVELKERPEEEWQTPGKREYEVRFATKGEVPSGPFLRYFYLGTNIKRLPFYAYRVEGVVESVYTIEPALPHMLTLFRPAGSLEPVTQTAIIRPLQEISISEVRYDQSLLKVDFRMGEEPGVLYMHITLKPVAVGDTQTNVHFTVTSGDASFQEVVPVKIFGNGGL